MSRRLPVLMLWLLVGLLAGPWALRAAPRPASSRPLRIKRVALLGLRSVQPRALQPWLKRLVPRGRVDAPTRARVARAVQQAVLDWFQGRGYGGTRVRVDVFHPGPQTSFVVLQVHVTEGVRARVGALDVTGLGPRDRQAALHRLALRSGQFFTAAELRRSRDAVGDLLADRGHAFVQVTPRFRAHAAGRLLDVTFHVVPGPVAHIAAIQVRGASRTGEILVRRALLLRVGERYHRSRLRGAVARLRRSGAFRTVTLQTLRRPRHQVALVVTVTPTAN